MAAIVWLCLAFEALRRGTADGQTDGCTERGVFGDP